jgi:exosortase B
LFGFLRFLPVAADTHCSPAPSSTAVAPPRIALLIVVLGLAILYLPTLWSLFNGAWGEDGQAHGPMILAIASWLIYRELPDLIAAGQTEIKQAAPRKSRVTLVSGWVVLLVGLLLYIVGRSQAIDFFEIGSLIWVLAGAVLLLFGAKALRLIWFPLFFMLFMIPLPGLLVAAVTMPMKIAVSICAEWILYALDYPVARSGVILQVGQYQLLVADACAGLHTLLTLEALGLLYLNLFRHESLLRNVSLALLIIPIAFSSNVIRVIVLSLVTYYFGDAAGQGYLHTFSGMVLFLSALLLVVGVDSLIRWFVRGRARAASEAVA